MLRTVVIFAVLTAAVASRLAGAVEPDARDAAPCADTAWPFWKTYVLRFITDDGRVMDHTGGGHTTSEGQGYALFFALVADDRALFDRLLAWTEANLAKGDLKANLPAWKWGRDADGAWKALDENSASDADLWIAFDLLEAGRLWNEPRYTALGRALAAKVVERETADLPGLGPMLLPAPLGFQLDADTWRLNPSYLPLPLLRAMRTHGIAGPWDALADNLVRLVREAAPLGFIADWVAFSAAGGFRPDPVAGPLGSHDAIRCYLWAGLTHDDDPQKATLSVRLSGMYRFWIANGYLPEKVDPWRRLPMPGMGPAGFLGAIRPEVGAMGRASDLARLEAQIAGFAHNGLYGEPPHYYEQNLLLFGAGFAEKRYRFAADGTLDLRWKMPCVPTPSSLP